MHFKAISLLALASVLPSMAAPTRRLQPRAPSSGFLEFCNIENWLYEDNGNWALYGKCHGNEQGSPYNGDGSRVIEGVPIAEKLFLGSCLTNDNGILRASREGHMSDSGNCKDCAIDDKAILQCSCRVKDYDGYKVSTINLNEIVGSENGKLVCFDIWSETQWPDDD